MEMTNIDLTKVIKSAEIHEQVFHSKETSASPIEFIYMLNILKKGGKISRALRRKPEIIYLNKNLGVNDYEHTLKYRGYFFIAKTESPIFDSDFLFNWV